MIKGLGTLKKLYLCRVSMSIHMPFLVQVGMPGLDPYGCAMWCPTQVHCQVSQDSIP